MASNPRENTAGATTPETPKTIEVRIKHAEAAKETNDCLFLYLQEVYTQYSTYELLTREAERLIRDILTAIIINARLAAFSQDEISKHESCREVVAQNGRAVMRARTIRSKLARGLSKMSAEDFS